MAAKTSKKLLKTLGSGKLMITGEQKISNTFCFRKDKKKQGLGITEYGRVFVQKPTEALDNLNDIRLS